MNHQNKLKTVTFDHGTEFTRHTTLLRKCEVGTYFCAPYSSWQKGSVEHANGIIRRWLPKNYTPDKLTNNMVANIQNAINNTPRKILNWKTPNELINRCT